MCSACSTWKSVQIHGSSTVNQSKEVVPDPVEEGIRDAFPVLRNILACRVRFRDVPESMKCIPNLEDAIGLPMPPSVVRNHACSHNVIARSVAVDCWKNRFKSCLKN